MPAVALNGRMPPPSAFERYSDEQLYALRALSVLPPAAAQSQSIRRGGTARTAGLRARRLRALPHAAALYQQHAHAGRGFQRSGRAPAQTYDILPESRRHRSRARMNTRRGTGYYKVPSLKGVWYRGPFEHMGSVATLEDWFDHGGFATTTCPPVSRAIA